MFSNENINELIKLLNSELDNRAELEQIKYALQVHTQGYFFEDVIEAYQADNDNSISHIVKTYRPITKGSIWKGVDNISRIFHKTGIKANGSLKTRLELDRIGFFTNYIDGFINTTTTKDPNAVSLWLKTKDGYKDHRIVESEYWVHKTETTILFIHPDTKYKAVPKYKTLKSHKVKTGEKKLFLNPTYVFISQDQYATLKPAKREGQDVIDWEIFNFDQPIIPYVETGISETGGLFHSPLHSFIAFGDYALLAHRTLRAVDSMFSYPRMTELVEKCTKCKGKGKDLCEKTPDNPSGLKTCEMCEGQGTISMQSVFKIYKREVNKEDPERTLNVPSVEFHVPPVQVLEYNKLNWKEYLQLGEEAIYVSQRTETGNTESAKSKEYNYHSMYSWLDRIGNEIYPNMQLSLNQGCVLNNLEPIVLEKQISYAILTEFEAFEYLNQIINSDSPIFIKTNEIEEFLNKYVSKSNPIHKIVSILKKVDIFCFYSKKELQTMSDSGVINDDHWRINAYAYPMLMRMYSKDPQVLENEEKTIKDLLTEIENTKPSGQVQQI